MPTIYRLLFGLLSVGLAVAGQNRLEADLLFDALFFYSAGILLLVVAFFRVKLPELSLHQVPIADEIEPTSWSHRWWWQLAVTLIYSVGLGAGIWALYLFNQDFERPASSAWPLYILSISLTLLSAALLDNASFTLAKFVQRHQAEHELDLGHVPIAPLRLGLRMVIFL